MAVVEMSTTPEERAAWAQAATALNKFYSDQDSADWELGRAEARREIDLDQQLVEYQVAVFDMLDEAMRDGS